MAREQSGQQNRDSSHYTYRCRICGWECRKAKMPYSSVPVTKTGSYGSAASPPSEEFTDVLYAATSLAFVAATDSVPAKITDSAHLFGDKFISSELPIRVATTSGTNDGDYTVAARGVTQGEIHLSSSDSLTTEDAATAGTVTISRVRYKQNITTGCPSCGSLNSR